MGRHLSIIELGKTLGYFSGDALKGVCRGATMAWLEACLLGEGALYDERVGYIVEHLPSIPDRVEAIKEKVKARQPITEEEKYLFQILGPVDICPHRRRAAA